MTLLSSAAADTASSPPRKPPLSSSPSTQPHQQMQQLPAHGSIPEEAYRVSQGAAKAYPHSKKVGNYLVGKSLGEGSFAKVKEGLHVVTGERVAIKIISKEKAKTDAYVRKNLRREGRILQQIRHANVVQLLEVLETENSYYLVVELCRGGDMMDHIVKKTRLSEAETKRYIRQIVLAIDYMHRMGILHRDLKIENLLLTDNQSVKIIDFGLSNMVKTIEESDGNIVTELCKTQCGSPAYAAPEVLSHKPYGTAVDVWSIGVNMFAMLTGNLPFTVKPFNIKALCQKMMSGEINPLPKDVSRSCRDLLLKLLNPLPEARIKLKEAMAHPWLQEATLATAGAGGGARLQPSPFPNRLRASDLSPDIVQHMVRALGLKASDVGRQVTANTPGACLAAYWLLSQKAERFCRQKNIEYPPSRPQRQQQQQPPPSATAETGRDLEVDYTTEASDGKSASEEAAAAAAAATSAATAPATAAATKEVDEPPSAHVHQQAKRVVNLNAATLAAAAHAVAVNAGGAPAAPANQSVPADAAEPLKSRTLPLRVQRRPESPVKSLGKAALAAPPFLVGLYPMKETVRREPSNLDLPASRERTVLAFSTPQKERIPVFESIREEAALDHQADKGDKAGGGQQGRLEAAHRRVAHLERKTTDTQLEVTNGFHPPLGQHPHRPSEYTVDTGQGKVRVPASSLPEVFLRHSKLLPAGETAVRARTSAELQLQSVDTTPSGTPVPQHQYHVTRARTQVNGGGVSVSREAAAAAAAASPSQGLRRVQTDGSRTDVATTVTIQARLIAGLQQQKFARVPVAAVAARQLQQHQLISANFSPPDLLQTQTTRFHSQQQQQLQLGQSSNGRQTERAKTFTSTR